MLQPKRTKYRKMHKGRNCGLSWNANVVSFGQYGLRATAHGQLTARQIEAARRSISRYVKRGGKLLIRVFQISQLQRNLLRLEWVQVRVMLSIGLLKFNQVV